MAREWPTFRLGDVCSKIGSGATPRVQNSATSVPRVAAGRTRDCQVGGGRSEAEEGLGKSLAATATMRDGG